MSFVNGKGHLCLRSVARTHVGHVRDRNEDSLVNRPAAGLWAVADGMGGHSRGEVASGRVKEALDSLSPPDNLQDYVASVRAGLEGVHGKLRDEAGWGVCGSTVAVLLIVEKAYACAWAGDSRVYRYRNGGLERLTRDHSLVEELVTAGVLTPDQARGHPLANHVTRTVGVGDRLDLAEVEGPIAAGDRFLLSSDGLHGVLSHDILADSGALPDLERAADALMAAALRAGAPDNVSLVLVETSPGS